MSKITFQHGDPTYGKQVDITPTPEAVLTPQGKYTHILYDITFVPDEDTSESPEGRMPMPEHYEAQRIELEGTADYGKIINAIIRNRYSQSQVEAILCNGNDTPEHKAELDELQEWRKKAKRIAKILFP